MEGKRALILYSSLTGNTAAVAEVMEKRLQHYRFETFSLNLTPKVNWDEVRAQTYFDDYDFICLGSPIIAGLPFEYLSDCLGLTPWKRTGSSPGHGTRPEDLTFRREGVPLPGIRNPNWKPAYGLVFATYGGSFYGPEECRATLEILKQYLQLRSVATVGMYACCGKLAYHKEPEGVTLRTYTDAAGQAHTGTVFSHFDTPNRPYPRDLQRAEFLISDIIEDYFYTSDGTPRAPESVYLSIS